MSEHTPGPWRLVGKSGLYSVEAEPYGMLCAIRYLGNADANLAEELANAMIMTAAPDLLTVCKRLLWLIEVEHKIDGGHITANAKEIIAKVEGTAKERE